MEVCILLYSIGCFFRREIEILLRESKFELIDNMDCQSLGETDYSSWTNYFIAKVMYVGV